jgi:DNA-directed RNA polymerase specialized sigma24 family protein
MDFAEFYASAKDDCLRAVLASTGDMQTAEDLVAEALARPHAAAAAGMPRGPDAGPGQRRAAGQDHRSRNEP